VTHHISISGVIYDAWTSTLSTRNLRRLASPIPKILKTGHVTLIAPIREF